MSHARRVLCIGAHPDDLEVYMGGSLLRLARAGATVRGVIVTDGERGTRQPSSGTRRDEQLRAFAFAGVEARFLGLPDRGLADVDDLGARLAREVEVFAPDLVFAPSVRDRHRDHAAVGRAVSVASNVWRWLDAPPTEAPTCFADIGPDWGPKEALIRCHASQIPFAGESRAHLPGGLDIVERARARDRACGRIMGVAFAEPFVAPAGGGVLRLIRETDGFFGGAG